MRRPLLRLAILFGWIPVAFVLGLATGSQGVFVAILGIGLLVSVVLRFTILR
jgi:hypothetical protein